jgi:hypothetical protein
VIGNGEMGRNIQYEQYENTRWCEKKKKERSGFIQHVICAMPSHSPYQAENPQFWLVAARCVLAVFHGHKGDILVRVFSSPLAVPSASTELDEA